MSQRTHRVSQNRVPSPGFHIPFSRNSRQKIPGNGCFSAHLVHAPTPIRRIPRTRVLYYIVLHQALCDMVQRQTRRCRRFGNMIFPKMVTATTFKITPNFAPPFLRPPGVKSRFVGVMSQYIACTTTTESTFCNPRVPLWYFGAQKIWSIGHFGNQSFGACAEHTRIFRALPT